MNGLEIFDLYNSTSTNQIDKFNNRFESKLHVNKNANKVDVNFEWLDIMEDTVQYLDNILRNPNRFIINEEDVVKIELARRVTVDSIKHLAKNTNLIQDIDKKTGDVKPAKILNINKEESFNTYENRFVYTIVQNMRMFLERKKSSLVGESSFKSSNQLSYSGNCSLGEEKVGIEIKINSDINSASQVVDKNGNGIEARIEKMSQRITDLTSTEVYKNLSRLHVALVTSPIKKTNVILKNVNFQYAMKLWTYMQEHVNDNSSVETNDDATYDDNGKLKKYFDESFLLDYLATRTLTDFNSKKVDKEKISERLIGNFVEKIIDLNAGISEEQLANLVARQFTVIKYRNVVTDRKIQKIYRDAIDRYLKKITKLDME